MPIVSESVRFQTPEGQRIVRRTAKRTARGPIRRKIEKKNEQKKKINPYWILIGILIVLSLFAFRTKKTTVLPTFLFGEWTTTNQRYADRYFELSKGVITIGIGGIDLDVYVISTVEKELKGQSTFYILNYSDLQGLEYQLSFYYLPANGGEIRIKNKEHIVWTQKNT